MTMRLQNRPSECAKNFMVTCMENLLTEWRKKKHSCFDVLLSNGFAQSEWGTKTNWNIKVMKKKKCV